MKCCNIKTLSYISAGLQLLICLFGIIFVTVVGVILKVKEAPLQLTSLIWLIGLVILFCLFITLLVGIKQNRLKLVSIFMYAAHALLAIGIIYVIYGIVMGFVHKEEIGQIFLDGFYELAVLGVEIALTTPIHMLHKEMHHSSSGHQQTDVKEQYGLSTNQPVHKPNYEV